LNKHRASVLIITAPSGAGKTSLIRALLDRCEGISLSVSHTTRLPRDGEHDGKHYHFISRVSFEQMIADQGFIEHAEVFGNYYGTSVNAVEALREQHMDVILELDWQGAEQIKQRWPEAVSVFIMPPSREALAARLNKRGLDTPEVINRRLSEAQLEMSYHTTFDYLVFNDDFERAADDLVTLVRALRLKTKQQTLRHQELIKNLLS